jgi:hypothetical protein
MTKRLIGYSLTTLVAIFLFVVGIIVLTIPYLVRACDVGCGGIVGVFLVQ